jgi:sugar/nucleoside kinase (ribokinase family)
MISSKPGLAAIGHAMVDNYIELPKEIFDSLDLSETFPTHVSVDTFGKIEKLIYEKLGNEIQITNACGGGAAIAALVFASLGGKSDFYGTVGRDKIGDYFAKTMSKRGVRGILWRTDKPTGQFRVFITGSNRRKIAVCPSGAREIRKFNPPDSMYVSGAILHLDGLLFDDMEFVASLAQKAHEADMKISLDISTLFIATKYGRQIIEFAKSGCDYVFANEVEFANLFQNRKKLETIDSGTLWIEKLGARGVRCHTGKETTLYTSSAIKVEDETGAGDAFAAGFLYGVMEAAPLLECAKMGTLAASEILKIHGSNFDPALMRFSVLGK